MVEITIEEFMNLEGKTIREAYEMYPQGVRTNNPELVTASGVPIKRYSTSLGRITADFRLGDEMFSEIVDNCADCKIEIKPFAVLSQLQFTYSPSKEETAKIEAWVKANEILEQSITTALCYLNIAARRYEEARSNCCEGTAQYLYYLEAVKHLNKAHFELRERKISPYLDGYKVVIHD